jgi:hypothetical protein
MCPARPGTLDDTATVTTPTGEGISHPVRDASARCIHARRRVQRNAVLLFNRALTDIAACRLCLYAVHVKTFASARAACRTVPKRSEHLACTDQYGSVSATTNLQGPQPRAQGFRHGYAVSLIAVRAYRLLACGPSVRSVCVSLY